jgi:thiamine pyrophosphokinase
MTQDDAGRPAQDRAGAHQAIEAVVVTGGAPLDAGAVAALAEGAYVVAADGGLDHARAAGLAPDALVGDLDSVSADGLAWAHEHATVHTHPADKAATDTELAVARALAVNPGRLTLLAGAGDRLDHTIAALGALGAPALDHLDAVEAWWGADHLLVATPDRPVALTDPVGTTFSVLAMHGPVSGVTITGARWPLDDVELPPLVGWGVSNEVAETVVHVSVAEGVLTVIVPHSQP